MKSPFILRNQRSLRGFFPVLFAGWLLVGAAAPLLAQKSYLAADRPDGIALLAPPPVPDSAEEAADLASAREVFKGRSAAEETRAMKDASLAFSLFAPALGPGLELEHLPKTQALMRQVRQDIGEAIDKPKDYWRRRRPYQLDSQLSLGAPEPSFSYPSGHSTRGTVYALVLAEVFPQQRDALLAIGRTIGWDRVLIGKHFPTDVYAGRVLGRAVFRELMASAQFRQDLAAARTEAQAALSIQHTADARQHN